MSKFAIVTGASRGFGRGISKVLANEGGYTVYACARTTEKLEALAKDCAGGPGKVIPYSLDQAKGNEAKVQEFVNTVAEAAKAAGTGISLVVNSSCGSLDGMTPYLGKPFWEHPASEFDAHVEIGARSSYVLSTMVIPKMIEAQVTNGLILQISSYGGFIYAFDVGYSVGHCATDRLSWDMAIELNSTEATNGTNKCKIRSCCLHPGGGVTEVAAFPGGETPLYVGLCVLALHADSTTPAFLDKANGKVLFTADLTTKTLEKDGLDGSGIKEEGPDADEVNKKRVEGLGFPQMMLAGKRGENNMDAELPNMTDFFADASTKACFPGCPQNP
ncbi:unnamed protein product [Amoebophrya sp. A120]|nr:unnamed protein product [Amoebophrya sp. A120]|eukprot:GSA120T00011297001.1